MGPVFCFSAKFPNEIEKRLRNKADKNSFGVNCVPDQANKEKKECNKI